MSWIAASLWDLVAPARRRKPPTKTQPAKPIMSQGAPRPVNGKLSMQQRYDALVDEMKSTHEIRVRKWRKSSSGVAWTIRYVRSGKVVKLIEAPYPRGPMSCAIFLHEVGHHAIGLGVYRPRCLEEHQVWVWALHTMQAKGFNVTDAVRRRVDRSMRYAVAKAKRRGLRQLPPELHRYA